ncbi:MAG: SEC-C domain-containing protein [Muribaculaceae bacterium]|nr:SEC-C domain-containing protein [Muribaculaceae bacterium]
MVTKSIENAQKRVEENNFGIRKRLVEYDDVMNAQRKGVYGKRQNALKGERIGTDIANMMYELADDLAARKYVSYEEFTDQLGKTFAIEPPVSAEEFAKIDSRVLADKIAEEAMATFARKKEKMAAAAAPYIKDFVEQQGAQGIIGVPVSDGRRMFNIKADIQECYANNCKPLGKAWEKAVLLSSIDAAWQEHLREMDELRKSVQNASYEQKDPLVIYKIEAFELWKKMLLEMNSKAIGTLMRGTLAVPDYEEAKAAQAEAQAAQAAQAQAMAQQTQQRSYNPYANYSTTRDTYPGESAQRQAATSVNRPSAPSQPVKAGPKIGRNDPCPCGSGKKYKNCHGKGM